MLKFFLKRQINKYPALYKVYYHLIRKNIGNKVKLPKSDHAFYFDGYPRSGNTYFAGLLKHSTPELQFAHHLHCVSGIKLALSKKLLVFIIIREPIESISSYYVMKHNKNVNLNSLIKHYCSYYEYLLANHKRIYFIYFPEWLKCKKTTLENLMKILDKGSSELTEEIIQEFDTKMKSIEKNKLGTAGSFPNKKKSELKNIAKAKIISTEQFKHAQYLFDNLKQATYLKSLNAEPVNAPS